MLAHEVITVKVYMSQEKCHFPSEPDRRNPLPKLPQGQTSLANQMAHLHSLSSTELLAQARCLSGLPLIKSNLPNPSPESNDAKGLVHPPPHPEPSVTPFSALALARYKKAANCVHPVRTTLPEEYRILCHIPSSPLLSLPLLPKHPPDFVPSESLPRSRWRK